jgi:hypothetical protein
VSNVVREASDRTLVLWLGTTSPELLRAACSRRALTVLLVAADEIKHVAPQARVLVLEVPTADPGFPLWGSRAVSDALAHGLHVALVQYEDDDKIPSMEDQAAAERFFAAVKALPRDPERVRALYRDWDRVAEWARIHQPGPGANEALRLQGDVPSDPAVQLLFRRAFSDLTAVSLELLSGGRSGASVWRVRPDSADRSRRALPFVAKIHEREKMRFEQSNYSVVRNAVESRLYAPLHAERSVEGDKLGLVVYDVVERALPFRVAVPTAPAALIASLFGQTLKGFHSCATQRLHSIAVEANRLKLLRWSDSLRDAASCARAIDDAVIQVDALARRFSAIPPMQFAAATVHGDPHAGNLFVAAGTCDVSIIDYGSILQDTLAAADAACLEVSLTFPPNEDLSTVARFQLPRDWLRAVYRYPLDPSAVPTLAGAGSWITDALRAIRSQVRLTEPRPAPYALALAGYLIRSASFADHAPVEERAIAYAIACHLVVSVEVELSRDDSREHSRPSLG